MRTTQLLTPALIISGAVILTGCANIPMTTDQALQQKQEAEKAAAAEATPEPIETPDDYTVEEFISNCIDKADGYLHFWTGTMEAGFGGGFHIRARDAKAWIAADGEYYADFPNTAVPGTHWYCRSDSKWFTQDMSDEGVKSWKSLRGAHYRQLEPNLQGDDYYRVSQEPDMSWQEDAYPDMTKEEKQKQLEWLNDPDAPGDPH